MLACNAALYSPSTFVWLIMQVMEGIFDSQARLDSF